MTNKRDLLAREKEVHLSALKVKAVKVVATAHNKYQISKLERSVSGSSSQGEKILTDTTVTGGGGLLASASAFVFGGGATTEQGAKKARTDTA